LLLSTSYYRVTGEVYDDIDPEGEFFRAMAEKIEEARAKFPKNWPTGELLFGASERDQFK